MHNNEHIPAILLIVFGLLSIFIAFKIAHFVLKVVLHLIGLVLLVGAVVMLGRRVRTSRRYADGSRPRRRHLDVLHSRVLLILVRPQIC